ncbi:AMP-dependent synthetase/ligase [uncultured Jatrophihabitans sp.]|uniref:AMP-dependent synthetase/ligase n=1 Tax=uncultured Jatrophihabitans sp. TaxID=1610747 RepID=UPI0035CAD93B
MSTPPTTLTAAFQATAGRTPHTIALATPDGTTRLTWRQYGTRVRALAAGLANLGVRRGDTVGIMLTNRVEFHLVDTAALHAGATPFSIYNTLAPEQIAHLFANAGNRVVVCEEQFLEQIRAAAAVDETAVETIVCVDADVAGTVSLRHVETTPATDFDFEASWRAVTPDDVLTIIYTSGTTGPSKGVEITHRNMLTELGATARIVPLDERDSVISYLPDAHIANRWGAHYTSLYRGMQIIPLPDMKQLISVLPSVHPTLFGAVPQVWYKLKAGIEAQLAAESSTVKRRLGQWAIEVGRRRARLLSDGQPVPRGLAVQHRIADRIVLGTIRARLGLDRVRFAATGAAAIDPEALEFVLALGLPCCEMWGMSELTCAVTVNRPDAIRIGTVGTALDVAELSLADDGELLVRGPLVMKGYRNDPEKTAETIDADGWLHTGDIASIDDDGYVRIVDRKKELMINASGKNMSPANIEGIVKVSCPLVGSVVAIGDDRPYVVALITLDPDAAAAFAQAHGLPPDAPATWAEDPAVLAAVSEGVDAANTRLARVEQIKRFVILPEVWEPGGDEITPTMKIRRRPVAEKYADRIDALYPRA